MKNENKKEYDHTIAELTKEGHRLLKLNRLQEAEEQYRLALEREPENEYALSGLGDTARKKGDFTSARGYFEHCLQSHPGNYYALFGLGDCYRGLNDLPKAIETWRACLDHEPNRLAALSSIGDAYRKLSDFANAKHHYSAALQISPSHRHAVIGLGYMYYDARMYQEAIAYWEDVMRRDESAANDAEILAAAGNCLRKITKFARAVEYFERVVKIEPEGFAGNFGMADCLRGLGECRAARRYYEKILEHDPGNPWILTRTGDMCVKMNDYAQAEKYFHRTLEIGDNLYARLGLARIRERTGDFRGAIQILTETDARYPGNHRVLSELKEYREKLK